MSESSELAARVHIDTKIKSITDLLNEIEVEGYDTVSQIKSVLTVELEIMNKLLESHEYEVAFKNKFKGVICE